MEDGRCKLGLQGRFELMRLTEAGATLRAAATAVGVAPATAHRWWHRWRNPSQAERVSRVCLRFAGCASRACLRFAGCAVLVARVGPVSATTKPRCPVEQRGFLR